MSGVATKLLLRRSRSVSGIRNNPILSPEVLTPESRLKSVSLRSLHCSILHPRAPKIRHLNASHSLLIDLDKHIAKVQELEYKVSELEARIAEREALRCAQNDSDSHEGCQSNRFTENLVSEEDRMAFQNRLNEAKKRAEELSRKTDMEEANILSWHSKRLKEVLQVLAAEDTPKLLLAAPAAENLEENKIFDALNALVGMANEESSSDNHIVHLKNLAIERENLKLMMEGCRAKLENAKLTCAECQSSLQNILASAAALRLQLKSSQSYLLSTLLKKEHDTVSKNMWVYGPNPIFTGLARIDEINASVQNTALDQALQKTEISQVVAEKNLTFAQRMVTKYSTRLQTGGHRLTAIETEINRQIEAFNATEDVTSQPTDVCKSKESEVMVINKIIVPPMVPTDAVC